MSRPSPAPGPSRNYLEMIPVPRVAAEPDRSEEASDRLVLLVPRFGHGLLARWLQPRLAPERRHVRVPLDARGTWLWRQLDGQKSVGELARGFVDAFPDDTEHATERVCRYVAALVDQDLLAERWPDGA